MPTPIDTTNNKSYAAESIVHFNFGVIATAVVDAFIKAATSTELPDTDTITYTFPGSEGPQDGDLATGVISTARNISVNVTHSSSIVAVDVLVTGTDVYGSVLSELISVTATGTDKTVAGKKAFKTVTSIDITSDSDSTSNTVNVGTGTVIGFPVATREVNDVLVLADGAIDSSATVALADSDTATATTGDVRGTFDPASAPDDSINYSIWHTYKYSHSDLQTLLHGVDQA
ncbi:MAG: hypothetical protein SWJ54_18645 [Cyanobacteriota bacterium]|nr:hypothetical protein [Cyanobacteriota bacterium]